MHTVRSLPLFVALALVSGCGDASRDPVKTPAPTPTTPTAGEPTAPTPTVTLYPGVTAALTVNLAAALPNYANPVWPVHYDAPVRAQTNAPADNAVTDGGATLGRVLFHDRTLSINGNISCANCHQQSNGLTDPARFSAGFNTVDRTTSHSMRVEMGFDAAHGGMNALISRMNGLRYYPELFKFVFGDTVITESRIQRAIAQYVRGAVSTDSRFDRAFAAVYNAALGDRGVSVAFASFTPDENRGKTLFLTPPNQGGGGCVACHVIPTFALAGAARSNGLDAGETRVFKSPSLKNVAVTGPYMHDGRFATLEQVVEHYVSGVQPGPALDNRLRLPTGQPVRLGLSANDKAALVAFMRTLTDSALMTDARFSSPFRP